MRLGGSFILALALVLAFSAPATAHRVNIFAFVDGGEIQAECAFSRGSPVLHGKITVLDATNNAVLLQGLTDAQGLFRAPLPQGARAAGHDLIVRINAGEGHQNEWRIAGADLADAALAPDLAGGNAGAAPDSKAAPDSVAAPLSPPPQAAAISPPAAPGQAGPQLTLSPQELEQLLSAALEQKLAPIRHMLAEQYNAGPSLRDIIGGLGWLMGLAGLAAYFKSRGPKRGNPS